MAEHSERERQVLRRERWALLNRIIKGGEKPMIVLSFVWLGLLIIDLSQGLSPALQVLGNVIWGIFIVDFLVQLFIAPDHLHYLRREWMTGLAILLPAFRILRLFRVFRLFRLARLGSSLSFLRLLTSLRRGLSALGKTFGRRGFGYVFALSVLVTFTGAAGMAHFENPAALAAAGITGGRAISDYEDALWWTAMIMTTMGSEYWPQTPSGRLLGFLIAAYASVVYGYLTATIASYFISRDREEARTREAASAPSSPS